MATPRFNTNIPWRHPARLIVRGDFASYERGSTAEQDKQRNEWQESMRVQLHDAELQLFRIERGSSSDTMALHVGSVCDIVSLQLHHKMFATVAGMPLHYIVRPPELPVLLAQFVKHNIQTGNNELFETPASSFVKSVNLADLFSGKLDHTFTVDAEPMAT